MAVNYKYELVGVLGYPVAENPTCVMQEAAFAELGLQWRYLNIEVKPEALPDAMRGVRAMGMKGINLTIPHKVAVMSLLYEISPDAALIGAVNTVRRVDDRLIGENTDGKGFIRGLREAGIDPRGKHIVVLGAGGAARAITVELALAGAAKLIVVNRGIDRGTALVADLQARTGANAKFEPWRDTYSIGSVTDILVNATSIGLYPNIEAMPAVDLKAARSELLVCDVVPNPPDTRLIQTARAMDLKTLTGLPIRFAASRWSSPPIDRGRYQQSLDGCPRTQADARTGAGSSRFSRRIRHGLLWRSALRRLGRGIAVIVDGAVVGSVAVSGLPEQEDMELAQIGVAAINNPKQV